MTTYVPLPTAVQASQVRVSIALTALSIAEIRPSVSMQQLVATVNELHAAVSDTIAVSQLFVGEVRSYDRAVEAIRTKILDLTSERSLARGRDAASYSRITTELLETFRRSRMLRPPTMAGCSLVTQRSLSVAEIPIGPGSSDRNSTDRLVKKAYKKRERRRLQV